jgi:hypothetical protein
MGQCFAISDVYSGNGCTSCQTKCTNNCGTGRQRERRVDDYDFLGSFGGDDVSHATFTVNPTTSACVAIQCSSAMMSCSADCMGSCMLDFAQ